MNKFQNGGLKVVGRPVSTVLSHCILLGARITHIRKYMVHTDPISSTMVNIACDYEINLSWVGSGHALRTHRRFLITGEVCAKARYTSCTSGFDDLIATMPAPSGVNDFSHIQCVVLRGVGAEAHSTCRGLDAVAANRKRQMPRFNRQRKSTVVKHVTHRGPDVYTLQILLDVFATSSLKPH
jgi:hypothetical protein